MSPGDQSYNAIGLMRQLSEHTAAAVAEAQEVLTSGSPVRACNEPQSDNKKFSDENADPADKELGNYQMPSKIMVLVFFVLKKGLLIWICVVCL